jgi:hypothetical protein
LLKLKNLLEFLAAWTEMYVRQCCFKIALASFDLILVHRQSTLLAALCIECEWLHLTASEVANPLIVSAAGSVDNVLPLGLIREIGTVD